MFGRSSYQFGSYQYIIALLLTFAFLIPSIWRALQLPSLSLLQTAESSVTDACLSSSNDASPLPGCPSILSKKVNIKRQSAQSIDQGLEHGSGRPAQLSLKERLAFAQTLPALPSLPALEDASQIIHVPGAHALGAEKVFLINLRHREDRRITSTALAKAIDLDLYMITASTTEDAHVQARQPLVHDDRTLAGYWPGSHVNLKEIACWASHAIIWRGVVEQQLSSAILLEDDIDLEYDTWPIMQTLLPAFTDGVDIVYLGHCDNPPGDLIATAVSVDSQQEFALHVALHPSCTTAYYITNAGAKKLTEYLRVPQEAVDDHLVELVKMKKLKAYSIHPPLAIQRPVDDANPSDITPDRSSAYFQIKMIGNLAWEAMRGVKRDILKHSALLRGDQENAKLWIHRAQAKLGAGT